MLTFKKSDEAYISKCGTYYIQKSTEDGWWSLFVSDRWEFGAETKKECVEMANILARMWGQNNP